MATSQEGQFPQVPERGPDPAGAALRVEGLTRRYGDRVAVQGLSFDVRAGEILGLVGPNGAGKTTTLRTVAGILPIQQGRVFVAGYDLDRDEVEARRALAWIPDDPRPFESLTVEEHLRFTARLYRVPGWEARADALLRRFELEDRRASLGGGLSRGMRQKLAFCCAWLTRPRLLLMDEPLSGLDPRGIRSARQAIREIAEEGAAVVVSSHLLELIEALAHRILILDRGRRVFLGTLEEAHASFAPHAQGDIEEIFLAATELNRGGAP